MFKALRKNEMLTIAICLFAFSLALGPFAMSVGLCLFLGTTIFHLKGILVSKKDLLFLCAYPMLFIIYIVAVFFTPYVERGLDLILRTLPLLIVPTLLVLTRAPQKTDYFLVKQYFIFGAFLSCLTSLFSAGLKLLKGAEFNSILYFGFTETMSFHPSYYSLYILTALIFLVKSPKLLIPGFKIPIAITLILSLVLSESKMVLVLSFLLALFYFLWALTKKRRVESLFVGILLLVFLASGVLLKGGRLDELVKVRSENEIGTLAEDGISQRVWLWTNAANHMKEKPLFGFGFGSPQELFPYKIGKEILKQDISFTYAQAARAVSSLNFHNNYIQIWYQFGSIGLIFFLGACYLVIKQAFQRKNLIGLLIYTIFLLMLNVEVMLNRQMGIFYFAFIPALLILENKDKV